MKHLLKFVLFLFLFSLTSCYIGGGNGGEPVISRQYDPVVITRTELANSLVLENTQEVENTGKIYIKDSYIFVNDKYKGFHIFDNSNPNNPQKIKFLKALGATDLAIKNDVIYINQATDLVAVSINVATSALTVHKRIENALTPIHSPDGDFESVNTDQVVIKWNPN